MLKQLKLSIAQKEKEAQRAALAAKKEKQEEKREQLEESLREAETADDIRLVREQVEEFEKESEEANLDEKIAELEKELKEIQAQLDEIKENTENGSQGAEPEKTDTEERGKNMNVLQVRELLKTGEYYERAEVKEFYDKFRNLRNVTGGELTIPEIVVNRIMDIAGDYSTVYPLVDKISAKGTVRILIDTDTSPAEWVEQNAGIPVGDVGTITDISFDGYKLGKAVFVDKNLLEDSIVNLDAYVTKKIARAIALGLEKAIIIGEGSEKKQMLGIIPALPESNKVELVAADTDVIGLVKPIAKIDTGDDASGEIIAVMKRTTYYGRILDVLSTNLNGQMVAVLPSFANPNINGIKVVFNNFVPEDSVLYGDYDKYTLIERGSVTVEKSEHVRWLEDQVGFKGRGRFDGKPTKPGAFVLVTLKDKEPANP